MALKKTLLTGFLVCGMLAGCKGSEDKPANATSQGTFNDLNARIDEIQKSNHSTLDALNGQIAQLKQQLAEGTQTNQASLNQLTVLIAELEKRADEKGKTDQETIRQLTGRIAELEGKSTTDQSTIEAQKKLLAQLRTDLDKALDPTEINALKETIGKIQAALDTAKADTTTADAIKKLEDRIAELQGKLDTLTTANQTIIGALNERIAALEDMVKGVAPITQELAQYVNTLRGANSSGDFTRGNTFPATALPFGFNFWTPVNRDDNNWFYQFKSSTNPDAGNEGTVLDKIMAFAVVHMPSPWIGNRQSLQIMPISDPSVTTKSGRAEKFQRKNEIAKAHYYSLTFDNGMQTEIAPTDHAAYFRFTAPANKLSTTILFDVFSGSGNLDIDQVNGTISGYTDQGNSSHRAPNLYFYAKFGSKITGSKKMGNNGVTSWVQFDTPDTGKVVGMKIATSFISVDQAKDNLNQEIADKSFDEIKALAEAAWNAKLNTVQVEGATDDQKVTLYSNMYRSFLYPNSAWENVKGTPTYASPYAPGNLLKPGKIWVNNGFWDTYRTTWPLYTLLFPEQSGQMIDGFVNGYKDGGWVTRWSGPGYEDSMVATSSDIIFADAYLKGVRNFDVQAAYDSMVRNASTFSSDSSKGRKGMEKSIFYGYTPTEVVIRDPAPGHVAWSLEGDLNDFGVSQLAEALKKEDDRAYFSNRAISYSNLFDSASTDSWAGGWFRSKNSAGDWQNNSIKPDTWGYGYTEGDAWSYAFLTPQDGQGLANLYGGRAQLKAKLDGFFSAKPSSGGGSYGWSEIHEIKEARKVAELANVGQYQHSNQPVHHSIYMYNYAGAPASGQKYLRDVMSKLYTSGLDNNGIPDGSGYIGDEDNGEQSAWYVFSAMGFYPVSMGRPEYAIGAPYFPKMTVWLKNAKNESRKITINAPSVSDTNRYVQSVRLNAKDITRSYLLHSEIADGATLDFIMGPNPSSWGTGEADVPSSITQGTAKPSPLQSVLPAKTYDVTASTPDKAANLFDRDSGTAWQSASGPAWIEASLQSDKKASAVTLYTITSSSDQAQDPANWTLKGSSDGTTWVVLDERKDQTFQWRRQTRPFALKTSATYAKYRLEFGGSGALSLAEFELLAEPQKP
ncbi:alpha-1,2-mannosidase [Phyllobacterium sp. 628]|uniref:GH92 family glycosyl hydrolase n=1 Tax=Phyllobacterium sp. 628 TaxID=2718938 RepID=UPI00166261EC|nr:GH92 family glycosyl hydrolase [Phyllobacterium sp. 628]QND51264.1 alpha-1,2-mannosidase [Phyllobacterium sp. 628]